MSVILLDVKEYADVASTMIECPEYYDRFYSFREQAFHNQMDKPTIEETKHAIKAFVERLYLANQLAFITMYGKAKEETIVRLEEHELDGGLLGSKSFLRTLESIHYNLYTNAGRIFLGREDEERLERYIRYTRDKLLAEHLDI